MLEPIINHQKEIKEIFKKMEFLRDNFDFGNSKVFLEEIKDLAKEMKKELEYHFNLQIYSVREHEKAKKFVMENLLVRDMLFRMLDFIILKADENSVDAFIKFDDFEEILKAYLKKEKGLFIQNLKSSLNEDEIEEIESKLKSLL
ncbi:MAG: phosphoribosylaminoimidazolecarboxamide formyltransferase [Nautiliaceae bacterium]